MKPAFVCAWALAAVISLLLGGRIWAAEGLWGESGKPVSTVTGVQSGVRLCPDGTGGHLLVWQDERDYMSTNTDLYAQRIDAAGNTRWADNGVAVCVANEMQYRQAIVSDDAGGFYAVWQDWRNGNSDIYAQHIGVSGTAQWGGGGKAICTDTRSQYNPQIATDGAGGAILIWEDQRIDGSHTDLYGQRLNAAGTELWTAGGLAIKGGDGDEILEDLTADDTGGAFLTWSDYRTLDYDIYVQRINAAGAPLWGAGGVPVCVTPTNQSDARLALDDAGGVFVAWNDARDGGTNIYGQHLNGSGAVLWAGNGRGLSVVPAWEYFPIPMRDGSGGFYLSWWHLQESTFESDVYIQRFDALGQPLWSQGNVPICSAPEDQDHILMHLDTAGYLRAVWRDQRSVSRTDLYTQRLTPDGQPLWGVDGLELARGHPNYNGPQMAQKGTGTLIAWGDDYTFMDSDIRAQWMVRPKPALQSLTPPSAPLGRTAPVVLQGSFFRDDLGETTYVKLTRGAQTVVGSAPVVAADGSSLTCVFDLTNTATATGDWFVVVYDSLGQTGTSSTVLFQVYSPHMTGLTWDSAPATALTTGSVDNLTGTLVCVADGYDRLLGLTLENLGTAESGSDVSGLSLWLQAGSVFQPATAVKLGSFTASGPKTWTLSLDRELDHGARLCLTADVAGGAGAGRICRMSLPAGGAVFAAGGNLSGSRLTSDTEQTVSVSAGAGLRFTANAPVHALPGQTGLTFAEIEVSNRGGAALAVNTLAFTVRDALGVSSLPTATILTHLRAQAGAGAVADWNPSTPAAVLTFSPAWVIPPFGSASVTLAGDLADMAPGTEFTVGLPDALCLNAGAVLAEAPAGFPLLTGRVKILEPALNRVFRCYPNPFQPAQQALNVACLMREPGSAVVTVLTLAGSAIIRQEYATLDAGLHTFTWNGRNQEGRLVLGGVYLLRLETRYAAGGGERVTGKVAVVR